MVMIYLVLLIIIHWFKFSLPRRKKVTFHAEIISKIVTDDAGRKCCEDDLQVIELRVQAKPEGFHLTNYGHAFIATPNMAYGAYANLDSSLARR